MMRYTTFRRSISALAVAALTTSSVQSQPGAQRVNASSQKHARASRIRGQVPRVDGMLDDAAWEQALPITDFVQKIPTEGAAPTVATEVRLLYDNHALYVGDAEGWTAEMRIPLSQLRFNAKAEQHWGLQLTRNVADIAERVQWTLIPVSAAGFSSRFGRLEGIDGVPPARRVELLPYVASDLTYRANESKANPFVDHFGARAGGDLKVGLGPNLTLDATINPDFGQVESDPAIVNLSAFENVFEERRPFFIEGNELLTGRGQSFIGRPTWFYSRRIGGAPHGSAGGDFRDAPTNTTILSAGKVTGRFKSGLSVGALAAVTPREFARTFTLATDSLGRIAVEPPSTFGVLRLQQEFGSRTAFLIWQQSRQDTDGAGRFIKPRDLLDATGATGDHFLVMKVSYLLGAR